MTEQNQSLQSNITTPPTTAGAVRLRREISTWVKPIGIIAIIFGAGGLCTNLLSLATQFFTSNFAASANTDLSNVLAAQQKMLAWILTASGLRITTDIMLLVAGALLLNRNPQGVRLSKLWGISKILVVAVGCWIGFLVAQAQMEAISQNTQSAVTTLPGGAQETLMILGIAFQVLWGCALPVFMLVWFSRLKIKTEVANWTPSSQSTGTENAL